MRPSDKSIRDMLRREASSVSIPDDMWKNISQQLDEDAVRAERRKQLKVSSSQWRPALVLAVAAGFFWFALIPTLPDMGTVFPADPSVPPMVQSPGTPDPYNDPKAAKAASQAPASTATKGVRQADATPSRSTAAADFTPSVLPGPAQH